MQRLWFALSLLSTSPSLDHEVPLVPPQAAATAAAAAAPPVIDASPQLKSLVIVDRPTKVAQVILDVALNDRTTEALENTLESLPAETEFVVLVIDSPGGLLTASRDISRIIESSHKKIVCVVDGLGASGAYYLLQSCGLRLMTARSNLMLHEAFVPSPQEPEANEALALSAVNSSMAWQQCHRLRISIPECHAQYSNGREWWLTPQEAVAVGAVDGIVETPMQVMLDISGIKPEATNK